METRTVVSTTTSDLKVSSKVRLLDGPLDPCTVVILGASGDLTARKIVPALYELFLHEGLPDGCLVVGCGRTKMDDSIFKEEMNRAVGQIKTIDESVWERFSRMLHYRVIEYDDPASYSSLAESLKEMEKRHGMGKNRIFYLAIPPSLYGVAARMLGTAGFSAENEDQHGWARIVVEKPFGNDLPSAMSLDQAIHEHWKEHQIFRIDHYLAKETVQNILMFRFANTIFEPVWNRRYIHSISITAAESIGVGHRAGYYEQAGVLRDMFQNHMLQLLSLTAMEPPAQFEADRVRDEKVKVYHALRPFPVGDLARHLTLGQYGSGIVDGVRVPAYRDESGVDPESLIPTYARMKVFVDNWRWQGIPFFLTSGKRLTRKLTEIAVQFKEVPHSMFRRVLAEGIVANRLVLGIYPEEKITLSFQTKTPGARVSLRKVTMDFNYQQNYTGPFLDAYEKALLDCMLGDHMLFWREDAVEVCWSFLTPVLEACETCGDRREMLKSYPAGSLGPE